jgi:hypothetical protein
MFSDAYVYIYVFELRKQGYLFSLTFTVTKYCIDSVFTVDKK